MVSGGMDDLLATAQFGGFQAVTCSAAARLIMRFKQRDDIATGTEDQLQNMDERQMAYLCEVTRLSPWTSATYSKYRPYLLVYKRLNTHHSCSPPYLGY